MTRPACRTCYGLLRRMTPMVKKQGSQTFINLVSSFAIDRKDSGNPAGGTGWITDRPFFDLGFPRKRIAFCVRVAERNHQIDFVQRYLVDSFGADVGEINADLLEHMAYLPR